jgi:hypothetical protein
MEGPFTLKITTTITDGNGVEFVNDTLIRTMPGYADLVLFQGKFLNVGIELQKAAEAKAKAAAARK